MLAVAPWSGLAAQHAAGPAAWTEVYAGSELEIYLRTLQAAGLVRAYPWSARRFTAAEVDRLMPRDSAHPWAARFDWRPGSAHFVSAAIVRPEGAARLNTGFPFGYNDGAVWAGRGTTLSGQGGLALRVGPVAAAYVPLVAWAENDVFHQQPTGLTDVPAFADSWNPAVIDHPQRFGDAPYTVVSRGQSTLEVSALGVAAGVSSANDFWGPAVDFPVILGNNAGGFPHVFAGTAVPIDLRIAKLHTRALFGRLSQTPWSMETGETAVRSASAAVVVVVPRWPPGLELGAMRFIHRVWARRGRLLQELGAPYRLNFSVANDPLQNQLASVFFRWVFPRAGAEVYGEYGTDDARYDVREVAVEPDHIAGFTVGARQVSRRPRGGLRVVRAEFQNLQRGALVESREQGSFYEHTGLRQGHTHSGQFLGSEWGRGGVAAKAAVDWYHPRGRWTVAWSRLGRGDLGDTVATAPQGSRTFDVLHTLGVEGLFFCGPVDLWAGATAVFEFNRDFRRDAFNLNLAVAMRVGLPE